ncbi:hypothetical protein Dimus_017002 [Dionaea muscipula]
MAEEATVADNQRVWKGGQKEMLRPWDQHADVISIPRFDYSAPSSFLNRSTSGFLITCPIKREKSATREAMSILEKYISSSTCSGFLEGFVDADKVLKRRKLCPIDGESAEATKCEHLSGDDNKADHCEDRHALSLVKLTRSGLLLFTPRSENSLDPVEVVSKIKLSLECGALKSPLWCHRIFPIQATCILNEKELGAIVLDLVLQFLHNRSNGLSRPVKFAVGYNRRGLEETLVKIVRKVSGNQNPFALLDRNKCFSVVAAAVKDAVANSVVDLKSPELCVLIELLPVSGVPNEAIVAAISVLPGDLVNSKPRLCVKALVSDPNGKEVGH